MQNHMCTYMYLKSINDNVFIKKFTYVQGIPSQTVKRNLALREERKDISDILWQFFSRKHKPILISRLTFIKKMGNYEKLHLMYVIKSKK